MKHSKANKFNLILVGFSLILLIVFVIFVDGAGSITKVLVSINPIWLILCVALIFAYWLLESVSLFVIYRKLNPQLKFGECITVTIIGQYFNCITPFASGGQPAQAYFMVKYGGKLSHIMTALLTKFIVYQSALTIFSLIVLIFNLNMMLTQMDFFVIPVIIGFVVNSFVIVMLCLVAVFKKATLKFANWVINLLAKIKIEKKPTEKKEYISNEIEVFYENFKFIKKNKGTLAVSFLVTMVQLLVFFIITYVIYLSFGLSEASPFKIISLQSLVLMVSSFVPLPGAMGAAEGSYYFLFKSFFDENQISVAIMFWRIVTFYFPILAGLIACIRERKKV